MSRQTKHKCLQQLLSTNVYRDENICPERLNTNVYSCNLEKIQMSIGGKTCKQIAVYLSMKYYLAIKKEWPFDTCSNMMNLIFITLNKRGLTKWYILYDTIDIKFQKICSKKRSAVAQVWSKEEQQEISKKHQEVLREDDSYVNQFQ